MQVKPSQLVPGCVLLRDVTGKTKHPLIPKQTVLTEKHNEILKGFLVNAVHVDTRLENGDIFHPNPVQMEVDEEVKEREEQLPFSQHFLEVVKSYKKVYTQIQGGMRLDILQIKGFLTPLLERTKEVDAFVKVLHQFGNKREYIFYHSVSVSILSSFLARKLGINQWIQVGIAGLLSDIGMAKIDQEIVFPEGLLHGQEMEKVIKLHPTYSYRLVEQIKILPQAVKLGILQHHERLDGSGYPLGVNFEKIHNYAQIIAVADVYHAIVSDRLYKDKQSPYKAMEKLEKYRFLKFKSEIVRQLTTTIAVFQLGDKLRLSDGRIGTVMFMDPDLPVRPIVRIGQTNETIALEQATHLYIEELLT